MVNYNKKNSSLYYDEEVNNMTLNQLLYFQTVSEYENYHKAAEKLYLSQPSLSRSISTLEEELGVMLFEKQGRGIVLTKAGKLFLEYTERILSECEIAKTKMNEIASGHGCIDIGYIFPLAGHYIPHKVRKFLNIEENAKVSFNFYQNHSPAIAQKVKMGELDLGFGAYIDNDDELEFYPLQKQKMVIITPTEHALDQYDEVAIQELMNYPVIGYDRGSGLGKYSKRLYRRLNMKPNIIVECPDEHSIMALVKEGFGIALVPEVDSLDEASVHIHSIKDMELVNRHYMFWMRDRYQLPAVQRFIEFMKEESDD